MIWLFPTRFQEKFKLRELVRRIQIWFRRIQRWFFPTSSSWKIAILGTLSPMHEKKYLCLIWLFSKLQKCNKTHENVTQIQSQREFSRTRKEGGGVEPKCEIWYLNGPKDLIFALPYLFLGGRNPYILNFF